MLIQIVSYICSFFKESKKKLQKGIDLLKNAVNRHEENPIFQQDWAPPRYILIILYIYTLHV